MFTDLRYALRVLRRQWMLAASAITILSLGIAACGAIFAVVDSVLVRPLAYPQPDRLVVLRQMDRRAGTAFV